MPDGTPEAAIIAISHTISRFNGFTQVIDFSKILNKQQRRTLLNAILTPFSWLYGAGVWVRNALFGMKVLPQESFDVPVVSVGNITVGGTGKTPHVEYIIEMLCRRYNIGVLSRGYKRKTKGFILASDSLSARDLGDEPFQISRKYNGLITMAVCENRRKGIHELLRINPDINLILLDDAFQHRYVKPKVNIVLVDFNRPPFNDKLLPLGTLREPPHRLLQSDLVVVTKCPTDIMPVDIRMMKENLDLFPSTELFFSNIRYADPVPVFPVPNPQISSLSWLQPTDTVNPGGHLLRRPRHPHLSPGEHQLQRQGTHLGSRYLVLEREDYTHPHHKAASAVAAPVARQLVRGRHDIYLQPDTWSRL